MSYLAQCIWHTEEWGAVEGGWSGAELATTNTAPPSAEAEHLPASSLQPGPGGGARPSTHNTTLYWFLLSLSAAAAGVRSPGSRLQARSARNRLSPARPRRHGRGAPASLDPHKATARLGPVRGHPSCNAACSLQHCSTAALQHAPHQHYFQRPASNIKHEAWASMTELSSVGTRRSILNYDALSLCLNIN